MESRLVLKSKTSFHFKITSFFLIPFGVLLLYLAQFMLKELYQDIYPQLIGIFFSLLIGLFGFFLLRSVYTCNIFYIYTDKIITKSVFGNIKRTIPIENLISWTEVERKTKNSSWFELFFFTDKSKFSINSQDHENYTKLKEKLTKDIPQDVIEVKKPSLWKVVAIIINTFFTFLCISATYNQYQVQNNVTKESDLIIITDELTNEPKIFKGSKGHRSIDIKLKSSPDFTYDISDESYKAMYSRDFVKDTKIGDSISIKISKEDYDKKIIKKTPLTLLDTQGYAIIKIYEVKYKNKIYLNLTDYHLALKENEYLYLIPLLIGIFPFLIALNLILKYNTIDLEIENQDEDES